MKNSSKRQYKWSASRFLNNLFILALIICLGTFCFSLAVTATQVKQIQTITVKPGDTLWNIAASIAPNEDPRNVIAKIRDLNNLDQSDLKIGQNLKVEIKD